MYGSGIMTAILTPEEDRSAEGHGIIYQRPDIAMAAVCARYCIPIRRTMDVPPEDPEKDTRTTRKKFIDGIVAGSFVNAPGCNNIIWIKDGKAELGFDPMGAIGI